MSSMCSRVSETVRSSCAHPVTLIAGFLFLVFSFQAFAQQRVIVNPKFVQRFQRNHTRMLDYNPSVQESDCYEAGSCFRYLGDAQCLWPSGTPIDNEGCMAGWITTDHYDDDLYTGLRQDGHIKAPTHVGIGPNLWGLNVPDGAAELNAENRGRLYQIICVAGGEVIPFSYKLGHPIFTGWPSSQARFGLFANDTIYPGTTISVVDSTVVSTPMGMVTQTGSVTAPSTAGLYQIGFEAILPALDTEGNYITDVTITLKPLVDLADSNVWITEGRTGSLLVRVNGTVPAGGISVSLQLGAGTASPSDYTFGTPVAYGTAVVGSASLLSNGAGGYLLFIPQGAYDGNALSDARNDTIFEPSGSVLIPISTTADTVIEDNERLSLTVEPPGTNGSSPQAQWELATALPCSPNPTLTTTATIIDNDVDLKATKVVDNAAPAAGSSVVYTVTFTNNTARPTVVPLTEHDATAAVADAVPSGLTFTSWTCTASDGARCPGGAVNGTTSGSGAISGNAVLPAGSGAAGGKVTYVINAFVGASKCTSATNTATISVPTSLQEGTAAAPGFTTPAPGGATDNSGRATISPVCPAALAVAVTDGSSTYTPGSTGTYTITVTNSGLGAATNLSVTDSLPGGVTLTATPSCTPTGTATCGTISGSAGGNSLAVTGASLATGAAHRLVYTLPVAFAPAMTADPLVHTASASASNAPTPVSGSDSDALAPFTVEIVKATSSTVAQPGGTVTYTVSVTNSGAVAAPNTIVADPIPPGLTSFSWSCTAAGGAACPNPSGSGAINETVAVFPVGGSVQYQISAAVDAAPLALVTNTATASPPAGGLCSDASAPPCSSSAALPAGAIVAIEKSTSTMVVLPNGAVSFAVTVTNSGSVAAPNTIVNDPLPAGIASQSWTCAALGGAICPAASGAGALSETIATLPAGSSVTFTLSAVAASLPPATISNTATITPPPGGTCVGSCSATVVTPSAVVIEVETESASTSTFTGQNVTLTFTVTNAGNAAADGLRIDNPVPPGLASFTWTCTAAGGAVCPNASGAGPISETGGTFPSGGSLTYVVTALVEVSGPSAMTNTVTVTPPAGGICSGSCTITMQVQVGNVVPAIPSLGTIGLLMLAASLAAAATLLLRR